MHKLKRASDPYELAPLLLIISPCARYSQQTDEHTDFPRSFDTDDGYEPSLEAWEPMNFGHQEVGSDCDALSDVNSEYT